VQFRVGPRTFVLVAHPDLAREVLVTQQRRFARGYAHRGLKLLLGEGLLTSEGEFHRRQRRIAQPAFHRERITRYAETMVEAAVRWDERWQGLPPDSRPRGSDDPPDRQSRSNGSDGPREGHPRAGGSLPTVDMHAEMMALTLGIAGETLFGARVEGLAAEVAGAMADALRAGPLAFLPFMQWALRLPLPVVRRFHRARARLDAIVYGLIAERRRAAAAGADDRGDLLSMLLVATPTRRRAGARR
jgi:cytochrome P450